MSPTPGRRADDTFSFPRVSGDEPEVSNAKPVTGLFSPRERG